MAGLTKKQAVDFGAGYNFTLNLHKGTKMSVAGFPLPAGVTVESSDPKVCSVSLSGSTVNLSAPEKGEAVLTATLLGVTVPGKVTVKVW